jgi:AraC-like DNA-binding protein
MLRFEQIHPVIRIAHFQNSVLMIPDRITYDHELMLMLGGTASFTIDGQTLPAQAGSLLFIPPFTPHSFSSLEPSSHIAVHFDFCLYGPDTAEEADGREPYAIVWPGGLTPSTLTSLAPGHWIEQTLREVVERHADVDDPLGVIDASCRLTRVLTQLLRWGASRATGDGLVSRVNQERIARVVAHITANLASTLTVEELAAVADVGRSRFVTLFREATGDSPQQYIQQRRIAEARRLLANPALQIKQIAAMTGFEDRFYFSKVFRRVDGLTPTQYRAAVLLDHEDE